MNERKFSKKNYIFFSVMSNEGFFLLSHVCLCSFHTGITRLVQLTRNRNLSLIQNLFLIPAQIILFSNNNMDSLYLHI